MKYCDDCIWNDDCLCDKFGVLVADDEEACASWASTEEKSLSNS